ncbi:MAG: hypothetical protein HXY39_20175 [Chloroflexi bacterium]|nr:hypothetical protein [Chloroflexota bacterium]
MDEHAVRARQIFLAQLAALDASLVRSMQALEAARRSDPAHYEAAQQCFQQLVDAQTRRLAELRLGIATQSPAAIPWDGLAATRSECEAIFAECLDFLGGTILRSAGLDNGICQVADALLAELSLRADIGYPRLTILAPNPSFAYRTDIIRLRFPEFTVWSLPFAAHELGHYVIKRERGSRFPYLFSDILRCEEQLQDTDEPRQRQRLEELFCDLFATYTLGPAYACSMVVLEAAPHTADVTPDAHPGDDFRVAWLLRVLELLDSGRNYTVVINHLRACWEACVQGAGGLVQHNAAAGNTDAAARINRWLAQMLPAIQRHFSAARFNGWPGALSMRDELMAGGTPEEICERFARRHHRPPALAEVVNGAWYWRLFEGDLRVPVDTLSADRSIATVDSTALGVCRVLARPHRGASDE